MKWHWRMGLWSTITGAALIIAGSILDADTARWMGGFMSGCGLVFLVWN